MNFAFGETVTVYRLAAKRDRDGDPEAARVPHTIDGCAINYQSTTEDNEHRETVLTWIEMYCPTGSDIKSNDKVKLPNGRTYLVDGDPATWHNPFTGDTPGMAVRLRGVF